MGVVAVSTIPNTRRIAILGPPAGGKSSLVSELRTVMGADVRCVNLDDKVIALCKERFLSGPLDDSIIDEAVGRLVDDYRAWTNAIVEIPHHDYIKLIQNGRLRLDEFDLVLVITASVGDLLARNDQRPYQIPAPYVLRCFGAAAAVVEHLKRQSIKWMLLDSSLMGSREMAGLVVDYLRQNVSKSLARMEIVPVPESVYMGGHYREDVEWSDDLARQMAHRFGVKTALDVGCGAGLTLDRFSNHGITCWGLEGNPRVLDGPCQSKERLLVVDFHKQWVKLPIEFDLVWCVEVLEHIPLLHEDNVVQTIVRNARKVVFVSAGQPGQLGYFHVNCRPRAYWIERFQSAGLKWMQEADAILSNLEGVGSFGKNFLKENGVIFQVPE